MLDITDALGRTFKFDAPPKRLVSLVPSTTETLYRCGVWEDVVGVTRYCVHPESAVDEKIIVGGTKQCNIEKLKALNPDFVFANQEENTPEMVAQIEALGVPVYVAFPKNHADALQDLLNMGTILGKMDIVSSWVQEFTERQSTLTTAPFSYIYLIWRKPWMAVGKDTFIHQQLALIGGQNALVDHSERYITLSDIHLLAHKNANILLSSEPFPFVDKHVEELVDLGVDRSKIHFINGEYCSWHGVRMIESLDYLVHWRRKQLS